jgi:long-chain acyl-CoA synthetase
MRFDDRPWLAAYDVGVPSEVPLPDQSYADLLQEAFRRFPRDPAYHFLGRATTFQEFQDQAYRFANMLRERGRWWRSTA